MLIYKKVAWDKTYCTVEILERNSVQERREIMWFVNTFLVLSSILALLLCIEEEKGWDPKGLQNWHTVDMHNLLKSSEMRGTKIQRKVYEARFHRSLSQQCPRMLRHIIVDKINCSRVAFKLEPQLRSIEVFQSMISSEELWKSIMLDRNCTELGGHSLEMCEEALSGRIGGPDTYIKYNLNREITNCYLEKKGELNNYMTKR